MDKPLWVQLAVLAVASIILGVGNNLISPNKIDWVRHWTPYSQLLGDKDDTEEVAPETPAESAPSVSDAEKEASVPEMILSNQGITDINVQQAYDIFKYGSDLVLWVDARDPELFAAGHIEGALLLHFYNQEEYINNLLAAVAERAPEALVIYCKGKECTDSHHLAEDLQAREGYPNIFVYKDGYDDWYQAGHPIAGEMGSATDASTATTAASEPAMDEALMAAIPEKVLANDGITDIGIDEALELYRYASDLTFWIDARDPDLFAEGHIDGSHLLHFYDQETYLEEIGQKIAEKAPESLVIYCKGKECTDSHHLAQDLLTKELGGRYFSNIFVYKDGFDDWYKAGHPIQGKLASEEKQPTETTAAVTPRELPEEKPAGMYLEHVVRDMLPFLFGCILAIGWKRFSQHKGAIIAASVVVGAFFIWAALPKLGNPLEFAKNIWNYDIAPGSVINLSALILPAFEMVCGLGLVFGFMRKGSGFIVSILLVIFIVAVSFNVARGHEFNCGCTATTTMFTDAYLAGWNDKYMLILRDIGLLVMSWMAFRCKNDQG